MTNVSVLNAPKADALQRPRYSLVVSSDAEHRIAAQRLRFDVFASEPGFAIPANASGLDEDRFDEYCDHLLVRDELTDQFVGCYRMLPPDKALEAGGYYTATEFDLTELDPEGNRTVEMGRACVRTEHRNGSVLTLMWAGILHYLQLTGYEAVMGCVSVPMQEEPTDVFGAHVRGVRDEMLSRYATQERVYPFNPVPGIEDIATPAKVKVPPLLRGYLRIGARVCGEPAYDPDFGVADFVALLHLKKANVRYLERLQAAAANLESGASA